MAYLARIAAGARKNKNQTHGWKINQESHHGRRRKNPSKLWSSLQINRSLELSLEARVIPQDQVILARAIFANNIRIMQECGVDKRQILNQKDAIWNTALARAGERLRQARRNQ